MAGSKKQRAHLAAVVARGALGGSGPAPFEQGGPAPELRQVFPFVADLLPADPSPAPSDPEPPAPELTPDEVGDRVDRLLAHVPRVGDPLARWQHESLDVLHALVDNGLQAHHIDAHLGRRVRECVLEVLGYGGLE